MSYVLWILDNEVEPGRFERLCVDLLGRDGYPLIVPVGGNHDRGRDAELEIVDSSGTGVSRTFFQFSLQQDWERKLASELEKVRRNRHEITDYVFVTSQTVSGHARDRWESRTRDEFGWKLRILDREWLRHRLEGRDSDLFERYFPPAPSAPGPVLIEGPTPRSTASDTGTASPWSLAAAGQHAEAAIAFRRLLETQPQRADAWAGMAWSEYQLHHYDDALASSAQAIALEPTDPQWQSVRACILTETGIQCGSRTSVLEGCRIFSRLAVGSSRWVDHYNEGNALSALDEHASAATCYERALAIDDTQAQVWKNFATALHHLGDHDRELECLDRALAIEPDLPEAMISKGVSLLMDHRDASGAVELLERARATTPQSFRRWSYAYEWLGHAYLQLGQPHTALARVREGIVASPGNRGMRVLEGQILHSIWPTDHALVPQAIAANEFLRALDTEEFAYAGELARLHLAVGDDTAARAAIIRWLSDQRADDLKFVDQLDLPLDWMLRSAGYLREYLVFRRYKPIEEYLVSDSQAPLVPRTLTSTRTAGTMTSALMVVFGLALATLDHAPRRRPRAVLLKSMREAANAIVVLLPQVFASFADQLEGVELSQEIAVDVLAAGVSAAPAVALVELSRVLGWIVALRAVPVSEDDLNQVIGRMELVSLQGKVLEETLMQMNDVLHLLPQD